MAYQLSPGINVTEFDATTVVPAVSTTTGAIAGVFQWGPANEPILISSEVDLVKRFGRPISNSSWSNAETFFTAADFLSYANSLYVVRADLGTAASNISSLASNILAAKYKGEIGNSLRVVAVDNGKWSTKTANVSSVFANTSYQSPSANCMHLAVVDIDGKISGASGTVLEVFQNVSLLQDTRTSDGTNNYVLDVVNAKSNWLIANTSANALTSFSSAEYYTNLSGGTLGTDEANAASNTSIITAFNKYLNQDDIDISLIMQGRANATIANGIVGICESRKDAMAFISPPLASNTAELINTWANTITPSSYSVIDTGYKYRYDRYNDKYIYTPLNGDIAGLCARTDNDRDPWFSPAGYNRGQIKNIIKLNYNPTKTDRDQLYSRNVNPVITQAGQGTVLFGDKTHFSIDSGSSAFDRINVRRLFIVLEKAIARASKGMLFEFNDEFTRAQFNNMIEPFLRNVQGRRGIYDYRVVCDETNNTPEVIDSNSFVGDIYVKPARSINFIQLNFVAVRTGVQFEEIVGQR